MFTGIIEGFGTVSDIRPAGEGKVLGVAADFDLERVRLGDSIAVNGACLTVVKVEKRRFSVDVSPETVSRTTFGSLRVGDTVNLERALRLSDRLDGHIVSGHIDGMGRVADRREQSNAITITFAVDPSLSRYMIEKGSVAVDGVSLTINRCDDESFDASIIPHTAGLTTVSRKRVGETVNIETDMIGKYVEKLMRPAPGSHGGQPSGGKMSMSFLAEHGFI